MTMARQNKKRRTSKRLKTNMVDRYRAILSDDDNSMVNVKGNNKDVIELLDDSDDDDDDLKVPANCKRPVSSNSEVETQMKATAAIARNTRNGKSRRSVSSRPTSVSCMKDRTVRAKFETCARHMKDLQFCNTMEKRRDRDSNPESQHFMFTYDEVVQRPHYSQYNRTRRDQPLSVFLTPEDVDVKDLGQKLLKIGKEMIKKSGKGYQCTTDREEYFDSVFGAVAKQKRNKEKQYYM